MKKTTLMAFLLALLAPIMSAWAGGGGTTTYYAALQASVSSSGGGKVYASTSNSAPAASNYKADQSTSGNQSSTTQNEGKNFYAFALADDVHEFSHWSSKDGGASVSSDNPYKVEVKCSSSSESSPTLTTVYAVFKTKKLPAFDITFVTSDAGTYTVNGAAPPAEGMPNLEEVTSVILKSTDPNFLSWNVGGTTVSDNPHTATCIAATTISANFLTADQVTTATTYDELTAALANAQYVKITIPSGKEITVAKGATLTVPSDKMLVVDGTLYVDGTLSIAGIVSGAGKLSKCFRHYVQTGENGASGQTANPFAPYPKEGSTYNIKYWVTKGSTPSSSVSVSGSGSNGMTVLNHVTFINGRGDEIRNTPVSSTASLTILTYNVDSSVAMNHVTSFRSSYDTPANAYTAGASAFKVLTADATYVGEASSKYSHSWGTTDCAGYGLTLSSELGGGSAFKFINGSITISGKVQATDCWVIKCSKFKATSYHSDHTKNQAFRFFDTESSGINIAASMATGGDGAVFYSGTYDFSFDGKSNWKVYGGLYKNDPTDFLAQGLNLVATRSPEHNNYYLVYTYIPQKVVQVGNDTENQYEKLQDAINAATGGQTIKLITNFMLRETVTIVAGKSVTINLNGYGITDSIGSIVVENNGALRIGNFAGDGGSCAAAIVNNGSLDITYGTYSGAITLNAGGMCTVHNGSFTGTLSMGSGVSDPTSVATLNGGRFKNSVETFLGDGYFQVLRSGMYQVEKFPYATKSAGSLSGAEKSWSLTSMESGDRSIWLTQNKARSAFSSDADWDRYAELDSSLSSYIDFTIDCVLTFDRAVESGSVKAYANAKVNINEALDRSLAANEEYRVLTTKIATLGSGWYQINFNRFLKGDDCPTTVSAGVADVNAANVGTVATLELQLCHLNNSTGVYNKDYAVATCRYMLDGKKAAIDRGANRLAYDSLAAAVSAANSGETVIVGADTDENVMLPGAGTYTIDPYGFAFTGTVSVPSGCTILSTSEANSAVVVQGVESDKKVTYVVEASVTAVDAPTAVSGLVYDGTEKTGVAAGTGYTLSGNTATAAGSYTATATLEEGYVWSDDSSEAKEISWSIGKASLTATAENKSVIRGETVPYTITYSGFVNGDDVSALTAAPTASCDYNAADMSATATSYPITLSGGSASNYDLTLVSGTLTVNQCVAIIEQGGETGHYTSLSAAVEAASGNTITVTVTANDTETVTLPQGKTLVVTVNDGIEANVKVNPAEGEFVEAETSGTTTTYVSKKITVEMKEPTATVEVTKIDNGTESDVTDAAEINAAVAKMMGNHDVPRTDNTDKLDVLDKITVTPTKIVEEVKGGQTVIRSATFDVTPNLNAGQTLAEGQKLKFRLPVDAAATQLSAIAYHNAVQIGVYPVTTENGEKFIEVESDSFSPYGYELLDGETANPVAAIGTTGYATFADAIAAANSQNVDEITILNGATESPDSAWKVADGKLVRKTYVAKIGETKYETIDELLVGLQTAIAGGSYANTITFLADVELADNFVIPQEMAQCPTTFDLNGKHITLATGKTHAIRNYGQLTLVDSAGGGSVTAPIPGINESGATFNMQGGTLICNEQGRNAVQNRGTFNMTGGSLQVSYVGSSSDSFGSACLSNSGTATITKGSLTSVNQRAYAIVNSGTLTINPAADSDVAVTGAHGAVAVDGGTVSISGGSYTATNYYALYVSNEASDPTVTVTGGTFDGNAYSAYIGSDVNESVTASVAISGGTFNDPIIESGKVADGSGFAISGGNFTTAVAEDYCATGYIPAAQDSETGMYTVKQGAYVAQVGTAKYETLADAFAAANAAGTATIEMIADYELVGNVGVTVNAGSDITLDLNGHTLSQVGPMSGAGYFIRNNGTLTLKDSTDTQKDGTGTGMMTTSSANPDTGAIPSYANNLINNYGTLTIESGSYKSLTNAGYASFVVDNYSGGTANITGGKLTNVAPAAYVVRMFLNSTTANNALNISGGIIEGTYAVWMQYPNNNANKGSLNVSGGTIKATDGYAVYAGGGGTRDASNIEVSFTGGTVGGTGVWLGSDTVFKSLSVSGGNYEAFGASAMNEKFISGGTFASTDLFSAGGRTDYKTVFADGYVKGDNADPETMSAYPYTVISAVASVTAGEEGSEKTTYFATFAEAIAAADEAGVDEITVLNGATESPDTDWQISGDKLVRKAYVAQIVRGGEVIAKYETFDGALEAAESGDTVQLLADVTGVTTTYNIDKALTIDGQGQYAIVAGENPDPRSVVDAWGGSRVMFDMTHSTANVTFKDITLDNGEGHYYSFLARVKSGTTTFEDATILHGAEADASGADGVGYGAAVQVDGGTVLVTGNFYADTHGAPLGANETGDRAAGIFPFTAFLYQSGGIHFDDAVSASIGQDLLLIGMVGAMDVANDEDRQMVQEMLDQMNVPAGYYPYTLKLGDSSMTSFTGVSPLGWNDIIDYGKEIMTTTSALGMEMNPATTPVEVGLLEDTVLPDTFVFEDSNFTVDGNGYALAGTIEYTDNAGQIHDIVMGTEGNALVLDMTDTTKPIVIGSGITVSNVTVEMTAEQATAGTPVIIWDAEHGVDAPENESGVTVALVDAQGEPTGDTAQLIWDDEMGMAYIGPCEARLTGPTHDNPIYTSLAHAIELAEQTGDTVTLLMDITGFSGTQAIAKSLTLDGDGHKIVAAADASGEEMFDVAGDVDVTITGLTLDGAHKYTYCVQAYGSDANLTLNNVTILHGTKEWFGGFNYGAGVHVNGANLTVSGSFTAFSGGKTDESFPFTGILYEGGTIRFEAGATASIANPEDATDTDLLLVGMLGALDVSDPADKAEVEAMLAGMNIPAGYYPYTLKINPDEWNSGFEQNTSFTGASPLGWNSIIDYGKAIMTAVSMDTAETPVEVGLLTDTELPDTFTYQDANFSVNGNGNALSGTIVFKNDAEGGLLRDIELGTEGKPLVIDLTQTTNAVDLGAGVTIADITVKMTAEQAHAGTVVFDWNTQEVTGDDLPQHGTVAVTVVDDQGGATGDTKSLIWDEEYGIAYIGPVEARLTGATHATPIYTTLADALARALDCDTVKLLTDAKLEQEQDVGVDVTLDLAGLAIAVTGDAGILVTNAMLSITNTVTNATDAITGTIKAGTEATPASLVKSGEGGVVRIPMGIFAAAEGQKVLEVADNGKFEVSGGYFSVAVLPEYCAAGYAPADAETGAPQPYTVAEAVEPFVYPIEGTAGVPITNKVWLATQFPSIYPDATKPVYASITNDLVTALSENGANGLPKWQDYVLGLDPRDLDAQLRLTASSKDASTVTISAVIDTTKFPVIPNVTVTFRLAAQNGDEWTTVEGCTGSATPAFDRPLDGVVDKVLRIFADIEVR